MTTKLSQHIESLPSNRAVTIKNVTCPYCAVELAADTSSKEHVIARNFVPKGTLNGSWNLILNACKPCNEQKGALENDISAITQYAAVWASNSDPDKLLAAEVLRKSKAKSALTGKSVSQSEVRTTVTLRSKFGLTMKIELEGPPQIDEARLFELARLQMVAFFYFVSYQDHSNRGGFWPGSFRPVTNTIRANWGSATMRAFADAVVDWEPRWRGAAAQDYFVVIMRKHPQHACWSWALEWNKQFRVIGFFGDAEVIESLLRDIPTPQMHITGKSADAKFGLVVDTPLNENDDNLFFYAPIDNQPELE